MARRNELKRIAQERGMDLDIMVMGALKQCGTIMEAAYVLGVYPHSVRYYMKRRNLKIVTSRSIVTTKD